MDNFNIRPLHLTFQSASASGSTHSSLYSPFQNTNKAFFNFSNAGSTSSHSTLKSSGFQYLLSTSLVSAVVEAAPLRDDVSIIVTQTIYENLGLADDVDTRPVRGIESSQLADDVSIVNIQTIYENLTIGEFVTGANYAGTTESSQVADFVTVNNIQATSEAAPLAEQVTAIVRLTARYGVKFNGIIRNTIPYTSKFRISQHVRPAYSTEFQAAIYNLVGATASGGTFVTPASGGTPVFQPNPFGGNVAIDGTGIIGTPAVGTPNKGVYINIPNTGTPGLSWREVYDWGMSLDYSGGSFAIDSTVFLGAGGTSLPIFGQLGTITDPGRAYSSNKRAYTTSGIFGAPLLNKQFRLIQNSNTLIQTLSNTQTLTARTVAAVIASVCGINLTWLAQDLPITDFSYEPTMNGISALNSMAQRVGANLRWMGGLNYYVAYPSTAIGSFIVPNPKLLTSTGLRENSHYDLETGVGGAVNINSFGAPVQSLSVFNSQSVNFVSGQTGQYLLNYNTSQGIQTGSTLTSPLVPVGKIGKQLTSSSPASIFTLPYNYQDVLVQILVPDSYAFSTARYITSDPNHWDIFVAPGFTGSGGTLGSTTGYIYTTLEAGAYVPKLKIDYRVLPDHPAITAGDFDMTIMATTKPIPQTSVNTTAQYQRPLQWVQTYKGTIDFSFYGTLPLPGMLATASLDDLTVTGVIENVGFSSARTVQLQVAQYTGINWLVPYMQVTA